MARSLTEPGTGDLPLATLVITILFTSICTGVVGLRVIAARKIKRQFKAHDYFIFLALLCVLGGAIVTGIALYYGALGRHIQTAHPNEMVRLLKLLHAGAVFWISASAFTKASVLCLLWGLFPKQWLRRAIWIMAVVVVLFFVGFFIEPFIICSPYPYYRDLIYRPETVWCGNQFAEDMVAASVNMVIDLILVLLPIPVIWNLKMSTAKKIRVIIIFSMGILVCGINISRVVYTKSASDADFTYFNGMEVILAQMEYYVGIVAATLPVLGPVVPTLRVFDKSSPFNSSIRNQFSSLPRRLRLKSESEEERSDKKRQHSSHTDESTDSLALQSKDSRTEASTKGEAYMGQADFESIPMDQPARISSCDKDRTEHAANSWV